MNVAPGPLYMHEEGVGNRKENGGGGLATETGVGDLVKGVGD